MGNSEFIYNFAEINGKVEMIEFLETLNSKEQAKVKAAMDKLIELLNSTNFPNEKLSKYLRDGIFELRVKLLNTISRNFYFFIEGKTIIFTHGYIKKTERIPNSEIEKAKFVKEYYKVKK
jgi:phage-related protein